MLLQTPTLEPIEFSQGDDVILNLVATDDQGNPIDITGASFSTQILGANGVGPIVFPDGQHTIVNAANGKFDLALADTDTPECGLGEHKQIITQITIAAVPQYYRGNNILTVYPPEPIQ